MSPDNKENKEEKSQPAKQIAAPLAVQNQMAAPSQPIKVEPFTQSPAYCGPAALKVLLSYFKKSFTEEQLASLCDATFEWGTEHDGLVQAVKAIDGFVFVKEEGTIDELKYFVKEEKLPVIIGWFDNNGRPGDHYSVVVNVTDKNVIIVDPATNEPERWLDIESFPAIWFDFVGKDNKERRGAGIW
ncbi:MAG: cysteine peptidase family C39 domain-containing protein [Candidatus Paceibacterota bacterium]|jgi:ABC-type bacteriocin/lantibiotic exporter with double-glycine peptidase domain